MYTKSLLPLSLAALTLLPSCPAPPIIVEVALTAVEIGVDIACAAGVNCGDAMGDSPGRRGGRGHKRSPYTMVLPRAASNETSANETQTLTLPPGVSQHSLDECSQSMNGKHASLNQTGESSFRAEGVSAPCMNLAVFFTDNGTPIPCGSACLDYKNLNQHDKQKLYNVVKSLDQKNSTSKKSS